MGKVVFVAMSGGVDSSVSAFLLKKSGYEVVGVTMCFNLPDPPDGRPVCCGAEAVSDARRVAGMIGVSHYVLDFGRELREKIIDNFISEYSAGRTPNPCVRCNELLKFDSLFDKATGMGADFLATGHYARIGVNPGPFLMKAADPAKDQSYFLYRIPKEKLNRILFPLGELNKTEVRNIALTEGLPVAEKPDSQEICFIPDKQSLTSLLDSAVPAIGQGAIIDSSGKKIGAHKGYTHYTVGQRRGLGVAAAQPLYVLSIDASTNTITAGFRDEILRSEFIAKDILLDEEVFRDGDVLKVKIRHVHREAEAVINVSGAVAKVVFKKPQFAVTPGQSAVFYAGERVVGGGIIDEVIR